MDTAEFGAVVAFAASAIVQRALRKMSKDPAEPRVFSQAKILVPVGLIGSIGMTLIMYYPISDYMSGRSNDIFSIIIPGLITLVAYTLLAHGFWRRFGVDHDKVWTRFGVLFYREVWFREITALKLGVQRIKLYAGDTMVNIDYNRFDYALVYLRLLEELQYRRFSFPQAEVDDSNWEIEAQLWRNSWAGKLYREHKDFYDSHPDALEYLNSLTEPPTSYMN